MIEQHKSQTFMANTYAAGELVDLTSLIWVDPFTGDASYDLRKATPKQLAALHIEETIVDQGGSVTRTVRIRPKDGVRYK